MLEAFREGEYYLIRETEWGAVYDHKFFKKDGKWKFLFNSSEEFNADGFMLAKRVVEALNKVERKEKLAKLLS